MIAMLTLAYVLTGVALEARANREDVVFTVVTVLLSPLATVIAPAVIGLGHLRRWVRRKWRTRHGR